MRRAASPRAAVAALALALTSATPAVAEGVQAFPAAEAFSCELRELPRGMQSFAPPVRHVAYVDVDEQAFAEARRLGILGEIERAETGLSPRQERRLAATIVREARDNGLDPRLVVALIQVESRFDSFAVSPKGAMGLMQLMPETGLWLAKRASLELRNPRYLFDFEHNVALGCRYFGELLKQFGSLEPALLAYNAGPATARRRVSEGRSDSVYAQRVLAEYERLGGGRGLQASAP